MSIPTDYIIFIVETDIEQLYTNIPETKEHQDDKLGGVNLLILEKNSNNNDNNDINNNNNKYNRSCLDW